MLKKITQNVNKDKFFNDLPKVSPEKSTWSTRSTNYQSCNLGQIVPIYYDEVLPGEKRKITLGMISHTTTPIAPIFNALYTELRAFFVPNRLAADLLNGYSTRKSPWVKVFGEDNASTSSDIIVPLANQTLPEISNRAGINLATSIGALASKDNIFDSLDLVNTGRVWQPNYLNLAAYELIYQRHYRNENYESATESDLYKILYNAYNTTTAFTLASTFTFEMANREKDYFTGAKPFTQKGDAIRVGLGNYADVILNDPSKVTSTTAPHAVKKNSDGDAWVLAAAGNIAENSLSGLVDSNGDPIVINPGKSLIADLKNASGISIEELRLLVKTQELLEKDAIWGSRYAESLNAHFGTCPLDLTLQEPQELYRTTITSNMQAIFQTSSTSGESSILGTIGANSTTQTEPFVILPETEFKEHGIIMICAVHKLQNVYSAKYFKPKQIFKRARFDFYTPELNDLGYQPITGFEFKNAGSLQAILGYNEAFAEYRYKFNKVHGALAEDFPYWAPAIADEYSTIAAMYKESTGILDKALSVTSTTAPQFYDAWGFEEVATKPMSLHSIPGMDGVI